MSTPTILVIDDSTTIRRMVDSHLSQEGYRVVLAPTGEIGLEMASEIQPDLILLDWKMPGMNGIEFLLEMKKVHPFATRILLTGYADKENAIKAINDVGLYQYVEKPWNNDDLKLTIENGLERRFLMGKLEDKIQEVQNVQQNLQEIQAQIIKAFM